MFRRCGIATLLVFGLLLTIWACCALWPVRKYWRDVTDRGTRISHDILFVHCDWGGVTVTKTVITYTTSADRASLDWAREVIRGYSPDALSEEPRRWLRVASYSPVKRDGPWIGVAEEQQFELQFWVPLIVFGVPSVFYVVANMRGRASGRHLNKSTSETKMR
jgi:hypothetical protein